MRVFQNGLENTLNSSGVDLHTNCMNTVTQYSTISLNNISWTFSREGYYYPSVIEDDLLYRQR